MRECRSGGAASVGTAGGDDDDDADGKDTQAMLRSLGIKVEDPAQRARARQAKQAYSRGMQLLQVRAEWLFTC